MQITVNPPIFSAVYTLNKFGFSRIFNTNDRWRTKLFLIYIQTEAFLNGIRDCSVTWTRVILDLDLDTINVGGVHQVLVVFL